MQPTNGSRGVDLNNTDHIRDVVRVVLSQPRGRSASPSSGIAVISANRGAGTTFISEAIAGHVNKSAMEREASRMTARLAERKGFSAVYEGGSQTITAVQEIVAVPLVCTDPSRLAITLDYRKLSRPGAEFGSVVAGTLAPELLQSQTIEGQSVDDVLHGLPIEWESMQHCRKECLRLLANVFRLVVIDMPSSEEDSGFPEVTSLVDGVILVIEENRTTKRDVARLSIEIEENGGKVIGLVLNKHTNLIPASLSGFFSKWG